MLSDQERKEELLRLLRESKKNGQEIVKKSSDFLQFGQQVIDLSDVSQELLGYVIPSGIDLEPAIRGWEYVRMQENTILESMGSISLPMAMTSGIAASYAMIDFANPDTIIRFVLPDNQDKARTAAEKLSSVIDKKGEKNETLLLLRQYGLANAPPGQKSPVELFETAWAAFDTPVTPTLPASTSLIPMRECINDTFGKAA